MRARVCVCCVVDMYGDDDDIASPDTRPHGVNGRDRSRTHNNNASRA